MKILSGKNKTQQTSGTSWKSKEVWESQRADHPQWQKSKTKNQRQKSGDKKTTKKQRGFWKSIRVGINLKI